METLASTSILLFFAFGILGQNLIFMRIWRYDRYTKPKKSFPMIGEMLLRIIAVILLADYITFPHQLRNTYSWEPSALRLVGIPLMIAGIGIVYGSQRQLGQNWIPGVGLHNKHMLVDSGYYARVRHPLYSGYGLGFLGMIILCGSNVSTVGALSYWLALVYRIPLEEKYLSGRFGKQYQAYKKRVPALIPRPLAKGA